MYNSDIQAARGITLDQAAAPGIGLLLGMTASRAHAKGAKDAGGLWYAC